MANVLGIIRNKASGVAGAVELFIDNVKQTQYKKCELMEYLTYLYCRFNRKFC